MNRRLIWAIGLGALPSCGGPAKEKAAPAATVQHPVSESSLTTITLSAEAVIRLGIKTAVVDSGMVGPTRTVGGEIIVPPGQALTIAAPTAGTVLPPDGRALPLPGARVAQGEALLRLLPLPANQASVREAVLVALARLQQAEAEARRVRALFADRLVAERESERAEADLVAARAAADAAAAQLAQVERGSATDVTGLASLRVAAPQSGVVGAVNVAAGQAVAAGTPLLELVSVDRLWVRVSLYAGDARTVLAGKSSWVTPLGSNAGPPVSAAPMRGPPTANPAAASVDLYYQLQGGRLRPGERVNVALPLAGSVSSMRTVPLDAIVYDAAGGTWVYERLDSLSFARRRVDLARVSGGLASLARGPAAGTRIVTAGAAELFGTEFGAGK